MRVPKCCECGKKFNYFDTLRNSYHIKCRNCGSEFTMDKGYKLTLVFLIPLPIFVVNNSIFTNRFPNMAGWPNALLYTIYVIGLLSFFPMLAKYSLVKESI